MPLPVGLPVSIGLVPSTTSTNTDLLRRRIQAELPKVQRGSRLGSCRVGQLEEANVAPSQNPDQSDLNAQFSPGDGPDGQDGILLVVATSEPDSDLINRYTRVALGADGWPGDVWEDQRGPSYTFGQVAKRDLYELLQSVSSREKRNVKNEVAEEQVTTAGVKNIEKGSVGIHLEGRWQNFAVSGGDGLGDSGRP
jgi:hypothetical protein